MQRTGAHDGKWNAAAAIPNMVVGLATAGSVWTSRLVLVQTDADRRGVSCAAAEVTMEE
jgi:hypothetical protein